MRIFEIPSNQGRLEKMIQETRNVFDIYTQGDVIERTIEGDTATIIQSKEATFFKLNGKVVHHDSNEVIRNMILKGLDYKSSISHTAKESERIRNTRGDNDSLISRIYGENISISYYPKGIVIHFINKHHSVERFYYDDFVELVKSKISPFGIIGKGNVIKIAEVTYKTSVLNDVINQFNKKFPQYIKCQPETLSKYS